MTENAKSGKREASMSTRVFVVGTDLRAPVEGMLLPSYELSAVATLDDIANLEERTDAEVLLFDDTRSACDVRDFLGAIRQRYAHQPLIVVSSNADPAEMNACQARCDDYVRWPVTARELSVRIDSAVRRTKTVDTMRSSANEQAERLRDAVGRAHVMSWISNPHGDITFFNRKWHEFTGAAAEQTLGMRWLDVLHADDRLRTIESHLEAAGEHAVGCIEYRLRRISGEYRTVSEIATPLFDSTGLYQGHVASIIDSLELPHADMGSQAERSGAIGVHAAQGERIWQYSDDLMAAVEWDGRFKAVNPAWIRTMAHSETTLRDKRFDDFVHAEDVPGTAAVLTRLRRSDASAQFECRMLHRDGTHRWIDWRVVPAGDGFYVMGRDATNDRQHAQALKDAEAQLRQAQKMEAIGHLTGGVAHDFNNLLTVVIGNLDSVQRHLPNDSSERVVRAARHAMHGAKRAAGLTQRLLAFARRRPLEPKEIDINTLVAAMAEMLTSTLGENILIRSALGKDLWRVVADPNQLENALLNLAVNARDAMPEGGELRIETSNEFLANPAKLAAQDLLAGQYVLLAVSDSGMGMSSDTLERVFEPFFTTKAAGRGTGLGLSQLYGFVKQSGGHVKIHSELGVGTSVKIYLPRSIAEALDCEHPRAAVPDAGASESILVVEDDDAVRSYSCEVLRELGYRVVEAKDGIAGLRQLQRDRSVALLFTDVGLPGLNGRELAREARQLQPTLKILFTTGHAHDTSADREQLEPNTAVINKLFTYADLAAKVREAIDR